MCMCVYVCVCMCVCMCVCVCVEDSRIIYKVITDKTLRKISLIRPRRLTEDTNKIL